MLTTTRFFIIFATLAALTGGCSVENEDYCADDSACLARGQVCHDEGHFCHDACLSDDDCADPSRPGHLASRPFCNQTSGDCVAGGTDGGLPDAPVPTKKQGEACGGDGECLSGYCVGSVCCDKACDNASTCKDGSVTAPSCVTGTCQLATNSCHGYACNAAGDACRVDCQDKSDCTGAFECVGTECVSDLSDGQSCGTNDKACKSGKCVDSVCCATDCPGLCASCNVSGSAGTCTKIPAGNDPDSECAGSSAACKGSCDGTGACSFPDATQSCGALSCSGGDLTTPVCDGTGGCESKKTSCSPYLCDAGGKACTTSCADHSGCVSASACDRSGAHADAKGLGTCLDTGKIVTVGPTEEITDALSKITTSKPYVVIPPKTYTKKLSLGNATVHLIGKGSAGNVKLKPLVAGAAITISDAATVSLQGITIDGASGHGVQCSVASTLSGLIVTESQIINNTGIGVAAAGCDVTVRRSFLQGNDSGGAQLTNGAFTLANSLVTNNGTSGPAGSLVGGVKVSAAAKLTFVNNTVAFNQTKAGVVAGVACSTVETLRNSIVWSNGSGAQLSSCEAEYSDVQGLTGGTGNINTDPKFDTAYKPQEPKCHDGGLSTAAGVSSIDLANGLRLKGSAVDMGAYEVK